MLASAAAAFADTFDLWVLTARDPAKFEAKSAEINEWRLSGGYEDMAPLAFRLIKESETVSDQNSAFRLAELALVAAPGDPQTHYTIMSMSLARKDMGRAIREGKEWLRTWFTDPWSQTATITRLVLALCLAALSAAVALIISAAPYYIPLVLHDFSDRLPKTGGNLMALGATLLLTAIAFFIGGVITAFLIMPAILLMAYTPWRYRIALALAASLAMGIFPALNQIERMTSVNGKRGWTLYKVYKGGSGEELASALETLFPPQDGKAAFARALVARRNGDTEKALSLLKIASTLGGADKTLINSETAAITYLAGNPKEAAAIFENEVSSRSGDWESWFNLGAMRMALLDVRGSEEALGKARAINPAMVEKFQQMTADAGGTLYPVPANLPEKWVREEIMSAKVAEGGWSSSLWSSLGFTSIVQPLHAAIIIIFGLILSKAAAAYKIAKRCKSCGMVKCSRCHRLVKDPDLCAGCFSIGRESTVDADSKAAKRKDIQEWTIKSKSALRWGAVLIPGWNNFVYLDGILSALLGTLWALAMGVLLSEYLALVPIGSWVGPGIMTTALIILAAIYLGCFVKAHVD